MTALDSRHHDHLMQSAIAEDVIHERGYYSLAAGDTTDAANLLHVKPATVKPAMHQGALVIPLHRLGEVEPFAYVLRPDAPDTGRDGKVRKYLYPKGITNIFDALPRHRDILGDPGRPLWLTEGAKKVDALASAFGDSIAAVNLNGVWGWRGRNSAGGKVASPDLQHIAFNDREVVLCPDGDYKTKREVQRAINALVRLLSARSGIGTIWLCSLPQPPNGAKVGVDDFLADGHTADALLSLLTPFHDAQGQARISFMPHPDTGVALLAPAGYDVRNQAVVRVDPTGATHHVYTGAIFVRSTGVDLQTGRYTITVSWSGREGLRDRTVTADTLSNRRAFSEQIGGAGAAIHEGNIKQVMTFLGEFVPTNEGNLPRRLESSTYGFVNGGLVLGDRSIGYDEPVAYTADGPRIGVGTDADAYPQALRTISTWDTPGLWLLLSLALAGPVIARIRPRRNPVIGLFGESGGGKTTAAQFCTGSFGRPASAPLKLEAGRSTTAGLFQSLERLGGLPLLIDEAHTAPAPARLESDCYQFANGQSYTRGGTDGRARGGGTIAGTLILCGEAIPDFRHAGSRNRVLFVDTAEHEPLGAERRSLEGAQRAQVLETAWEKGAGHFAPRVLETLWRDWTAFRASVDAWGQDTAIRTLGPWREPVAIAAATLLVALTTASVELMVGAETIIDRWADLLHVGHERVNPASDAWEQVQLMLAQARLRDDSDVVDGRVATPARWEYLEADHGGGVIACRKVGEPYWRVPTSTPQFVARVGQTAAQEFGREWQRQGKVLPSADGKTTAIERLYPRGVARVLRVPMAEVEGDEV